MRQITSVHNKLVKYILQLEQKGSFRRSQRKFIVEGRREVELALRGGYRFETLLFEPSLYSEEQVYQLIAKYGLDDVELISVSPEVYSRIAYRESTEGLLAIAHWRDHSLSSFKLSSNPLILVAENIEKPGNIGAILRTVDAAGIDGLILANPITDIYNPNIIRSSVGGVFTVQIGLGSTQEVIDFLSDREISLYAAALQDSSPYYLEDYRISSAIAVGNEAQGLSEQIRNAAKKRILIPMRGQLDSLNVSVSAAVLIFEAVRQRQMK